MVFDFCVDRLVQKCSSQPAPKKPDCFAKQRKEHFSTTATYYIGQMDRFARLISSKYGVDKCAVSLRNAKIKINNILKKHVESGLQKKTSKNDKSIADAIVHEWNAIRKEMLIDTTDFFDSAFEMILNDRHVRQRGTNYRSIPSKAKMPAEFIKLQHEIVGNANKRAGAKICSMVDEMRLHVSIIMGANQDELQKILDRCDRLLCDNKHFLEVLNKASDLVHEAFSIRDSCQKALRKGQYDAVVEKPEEMLKLQQTEADIQRAINRFIVDEDSMNFDIVLV